MNVIFNKQLYVHLFILFATFTFTVNSAIGQDLTFEIEDHFEIHDDPDIGIKLMPAEQCESNSSDDFGFVFKRSRKRILSDVSAPADGSCGDVFDDPILEFYPSDFNNFGFVITSLGLPTHPWDRIYGGSISATGAINGPYNSLYNNHIILPGGRNVLGENDDLIDDGVIFSPSGVGHDSDITLWSKDDIVMNYSYTGGQTDGQFVVSETNPLNVKFKVGMGGTIFMPDLPITSTSHPIVVFNPADGQLYYQTFTDLVNASENNQALQSKIQNLEADNMDLRNHLKRLIDEVGQLKKSIETNHSQN